MQGQLFEGTEYGNMLRFVAVSALDSSGTQPAVFCFAIHLFAPCNVLQLTFILNIPL
jgi:hypothetical protein